MDEVSKTPLATRLRAVMADLDYLQKDGRNDHHGYRYVSEAAVKAAVSKALRAHGLALVGAEIEVHAGTTPSAAVVSVSLFVGDDDGNEIRLEGVGGDQDKSGKAVMKATAAAVKYALTTGFLIATGDDPEDDGLKAREERKAGPKATPKPARTNAAVAKQVSAEEETW